MTEQPRVDRAAAFAGGEHLDVGAQVRGGHDIGIDGRAAHGEGEQDGALHGFALSTQPVIVPAIGAPGGPKLSVRSNRFESENVA